MVLARVSAIARSRPGAWWYWLFFASSFVVLLVNIALTALERGPLPWIASATAVAALGSFTSGRLFATTGRMLAGAGVAASVILGELEAGSGPKFYKEGARWLMLALLFALIVLAAHLAQEILRQQEEGHVQAARERRWEEEAARHQETMAALHRLAIAANRGTWSRAAATAIVVGGTAWLLGKRGRQKLVGDRRLELVVTCTSAQCPGR